MTLDELHQIFNTAACEGTEADGIRAMLQAILDAYPSHSEPDEDGFRDWDCCSVDLRNGIEQLINERK